MLVKRGFELLNKMVEEVPDQLNRVVEKYVSQEPIIEYREGRVIIDKDFIEVFELIENFNLQSTRQYFQSPEYLKEIPNDFISLLVEHRLALDKGEDNDLKRICVFLFGLGVASNFENKPATELIKEKMNDLYEKRYNIQSIWNKIIGKTTQYYSVYLDTFTVGTIALLLNKPVELISEQCVKKIIEGEM